MPPASGRRTCGVRRGTTPLAARPPMRWSARVEQRLGSTRTPEGLEVAFATAGHGTPLLFVAGCLGHLELSGALPAERQFLEGLANGRTLLRYDRPGCGLSDREVG